MTAEALRVLRPKGIFCIIEHNPLNPVTRLIVARTPVDADALLLTAGETHKLLSAGSRVLGRNYFLLFPERLYKFGRKVESLLGKVPLGGQYAVFSRKE
jgi:hypothetical protein